MNRIKSSLVALTLVLLTAAGTVVSLPQPSYAQSYPGCPDYIQPFMIPTWYKGLQKPDCSMETPSRDSDGSSMTVFIVKIALNVIQALLAVVAYVTIFFIIKGGFGYIISTGSSDGMQSAKKTITNAVIGLIIALLSAAIVNAIGGAIK